MYVLQYVTCPHKYSGLENISGNISYFQFAQSKTDICPQQHSYRVKKKKKKLTIIHSINEHAHLEGQCVLT